jgi:16S rRNA (guanine527-N7)-methyltransferase
LDEEAAKKWLRDELGVPRETLVLLDDFVGLLKSENEHQNLVARGSFDHVWSRHIVDSAQLLRFAPATSGAWLDLGTGAGFPGLIIAMLHRSKVVMVEERKLRAGFLTRVVDRFGLADRASVIGAKLEKFESVPFDVITARAFAPLERLLALAERFATPATRWVLPKGRNATSELAAAQASWQGDFRLEPSITDADARIIVAEQVRRKTEGKRSR